MDVGVASSEHAQTTLKLAVQTHLLLELVTGASAFATIESWIYHSSERWILHIALLGWAVCLSK